ncbi:hypothetical protein PILCRDRAFT_14319 [Piloderma croceum F 1598]|uniref:Uncharacterized protein n=1 Tax=Piloderma croceum (strain F 1598) TaxID=765440 RepID=A0A0C3F394_PILCF|nr:hypothetical protein PILCRDRAFT_14319 [Piloderma croceum F 1598]
MSAENVAPVRTPHPTRRVAPYDSRGHANIRHGQQSSFGSSGMFGPSPLQPLSLSPQDGFPQLLDSSGAESDYPYGCSNQTNESAQTFTRTPVDTTFLPRSATTSAQFVANLANGFKLTPEHREQAQEFNASMLDASTKMTVLYAQGLATDEQIKQMADVLDQAMKKLGRIEKVAFKNLLRHFLIKPAITYKTIVKNAEAYISRHWSKYHLDVYSTDDIIKTTVNAFLVEQLNGIKSKYRKSIFKLTAVQMPLDEFAQALVDEYHMVPKPKTIPNNILANVALLRSVAAPLAAKKNVKGGDTGFWKELEKKLFELSVLNGTDRTSALWVWWEDERIQYDRNQYKEADVRIPEAEEDESEPEEQPEEVPQEQEDEPEDESI